MWSPLFMVWNPPMECGNGHRLRYPNVTVVRDAEDLFRDPSIALVVIATPTDTHLDLARRALLAGKHVVVDKPLATSATEVDELASIARERGLVLAQPSFGGLAHRLWIPLATP